MSIVAIFIQRECPCVVWLAFIPRWITEYATDCRNDFTSDTGNSSVSSTIILVHRGLYGIEWENESKWWDERDIGGVRGSFQVSLTLDLLVEDDSNIEN